MMQQIALIYGEILILFCWECRRHRYRPGPILFGLLYACSALLCQLTLVASCQQHTWRAAAQFCSHSRRDQFLPRHHGIRLRPAALTRLGTLTSLAERGPRRGSQHSYWNILLIIVFIGIIGSVSTSVAGCLHSIVWSVFKL